MTRRAGWFVARRRYQLAELALFVPWVTLVLASFRPVTDNSFLWHIKAGALQNGSGQILTTDPFSFTVGGDRWLTQSWLAESLYGALHSSFGITFAGWMLLAVGALTLGAAGLTVHRISRNLVVTAVLLVLTALLMSPVLVPRPVVISLLAFALVVLTWEDKRLHWAVPFMFWMWASVHGSFFLGLAYIGLRIIGRREWSQSPTLLAGGLATLLTPHGLGVLEVVYGFVSARPYLGLMQEWRSPDFLTPALAPFLVGLFLLLYFGSRAWLRPRVLWTVVPFTVLAMSASRAVFPAWLALVPTIAEGGRNVPRWLGHGFPGPIGIATLALMLTLPFVFTQPVDLDDEVFPILAASHLQDVPTFHDDLTGGYLIYAETFSGGVFIDDRAELYRERLEELVKVRAARTLWEEVFVRDGIEQALITGDSPIGLMLEAAGWRVVYEDPQFSILRP